VYKEDGTKKYDQTSYTLWRAICWVDEERYAEGTTWRKKTPKSRLKM